MEFTIPWQLVGTFDVTREPPPELRKSTFSFLVPVHFRPTGVLGVVPGSGGNTNPSPPSPYDPVLFPGPENTPWVPQDQPPDHTVGVGFDLAPTLRPHASPRGSQSRREWFWLGQGLSPDGPFSGYWTRRSHILEPSVLETSTRIRVRDGKCRHTKNVCVKI